MSEPTPAPRTPEAAEAWLRRWIPASHQEDADAAIADLRGCDHEAHVDAGDEDGAAR